MILCLILRVIKTVLIPYQTFELEDIRMNSIDDPERIIGLI